VQILITGATGFIGGHIVKQLQDQGHDLALFVMETDLGLELTHLDTVIIQGDLRNFAAAKNSIQEFNPEVCIHLAWEGIPDFSQQLSRLNLNLSIDFLDFLLDNTRCNKVIIAGSCWEYGKTQGICRESDPVVVQSYFTWAKHALHEYLAVKCAQKGITLNWFRLFYVYGPGQRAGSLIPTLIESLNASKAPAIRSPMNQNDFVYVDDVAKAFHMAAVNDIPSGIYNLGSGASTSVYDVCRIAERLTTGQTCLSEQLINTTTEHSVCAFWADMSKTSQTLNWTVSTPLEAGIEKHIHALRRSSQ